MIAKPFLSLIIWIFGLISQQQNSMHKHYQEKQLTFGSHGHTIHNAQVFSPTKEWIVYDTRNDDTQIGSTDRIEMVNTYTGEVKALYRTKNQSEFGPGVGAVSFSPMDDKVIFIHGIRNADKAKPYAINRRTGVSIKTDRPFEPIFMDARDVIAPYTPGALRGGTHAHSWSADGQWISFTYNDAVLGAQRVNTDKQDLRTVGVMVPGKVIVTDDGSLENNSGACFSVIVARVTADPTWGSDEIDRAFDETWIGNNGYVKADGSLQKRAIAFQGNVHSESGDTVTEVFVLDLPADIKRSSLENPLEGTQTALPGVPIGVVQRRLTYGAHISGPRHWLRSTADGRLILYLAKDKQQLVQVFGVSTVDGNIKQITQNSFSIQGPFNVHPKGNEIVYTADNSVMITDITTGETKRITARFDNEDKPVGAPVFSPDGKDIAYNRYTRMDAGRFLQIYLLSQRNE